MKRLKKSLRIVSFSILVLASCYIAILLYPTPFFAYGAQYENIAVHSDRPIDANIRNVAAKALKSVSRSQLYDPDIRFDVYLCNDLWRFQIFTQWNKYAWAITQMHLNGNIYFRPTNVANDKIIPPDEWYAAENPFSFADRPLSYYFGHEMTHVLQMRYAGKLDFATPTWLTEGYADYIGKNGNFDYDENLRLLRAWDPQLDPQKGLYRYYQLLVVYLLDKKWLTVKQLYENTPNEKTILWDILAQKN